jgi:hypothetical protein
MLMGIRMPQVRPAAPVKSHRRSLRKRRKATASRPILSRSSGSLVNTNGGSQPNIESVIWGGGLLPL